MLCKICNKEFKNIRGVGKHVNSEHSLTLLDYHIKYEGFIIPKCPYCNNNKKLRSGLKFIRTCDNVKCKQQYILDNPITLSLDVRENIRKSRFAYLKKKTGGTAWERKNQGKMSYLEQWFYDNVILRFNLSNKFDIVNEYAEYPYFIDFAFLNIKLAVELDGKWHEQRLEHDNKRDNHLSSLGWKIFRIKYNDNLEEKVKEFLLLIGQDNIPEKLFDDKIYKYREIKTKIKQNKKCPDCGVDIHRQAVRCVKCSSIKRRKVERPSKEILLNELKDSSFTKLGRKYGVRDNTIRKWIK